MNYDLFDKSTSLPESASGAQPCAERDGTMTAPFSPSPVRASLSARQAKEQGLLTSGTFGPLRSISSANSVLQSSLASRLRARTDALGSTLYRLTWKQRHTPEGRLICALRASARRTSGSDSTLSGWGTPTAEENSGDPEKKAARRLRAKEKWKGISGNGFGFSTAEQAQLAGWPSPCTPNGGRSMSTEKMDATGRTTDGRKHTAHLEHAVKFAGWPTPTSRDWKDGAECNYPIKSQLGRMVWITGPARLTASGEMLTGSDAAMESGGQLSPEHSLWLQGIQTEWAFCGARVTRSTKRSRKDSSKPSAS